MELIKQALDTDFFSGMTQQEVEDLLLYRLNGVRKTYSKGETVVHAGLPVERLMIVASGNLHVYEAASEERPVLVREIGVDGVLGLWILHVPSVECWPGTVVAAEQTTLISLDIDRVRRFMATSDPRLVRLSLNMSSILASEIFSFWRKLMVMDSGSIEARVAAYLTALDNEAGHTGRVTVPFDRERMAEYFGVSRPALSRALGRLRDRGVLVWHKDMFILKSK